MDNQTQEKNPGTLSAIDKPPRKPFKVVKYAIILLLGVFAAKFLFSFLDARLSEQKKAQKPRQKSTINTAEKVIAPPPPLKKVIVERIKPTEKTIPPELVLNGIAASGSDGWAIIDDRVVKAGDTIKGAEVVGIYADRVDLKFEGGTFSLSIK
ncbi:MAG: hypothetical protein Q8L26_06660 [Candidatus Omnitrophota bacterium]|nr:hypothetical protein [Candidatus Omnitrophota bacterium]